MMHPVRHAASPCAGRPSRPRRRPPAPATRWRQPGHSSARSGPTIARKARHVTGQEADRGTRQRPVCQGAGAKRSLTAVEQVHPPGGQHALNLARRQSPRGQPLRRAERRRHAGRLPQGSIMLPMLLPAAWPRKVAEPQRPATRRLSTSFGRSASTGRQSRSASRPCIAGWRRWRPSLRAMTSSNSAPPRASSTVTTYSPTRRRVAHAPTPAPVRIRTHSLEARKPLVPRQPHEIYRHPQAGPARRWSGVGCGCRPGCRCSGGRRCSPRQRRGRWSGRTSTRRPWHSPRRPPHGSGA